MKFWNKAESSDDIYIYGDIVSERWEDSDVTAKSFLEDLKACKGAVNLHINSSGGDVFQALAISNTLKSYKGDVNIFIEGICASAATLITCAGQKVSMAKNALMMIHTPSVGLMGYYDALELEKVQKSLQAVEGVILDTYKMRLPEKSHSEVAKMLTAETWLTADEAQELGFVDEITGAVDMEVDDARQLLIVNRLELDCKELGEKVKTKMKLQEVKKVEEKLDIKQANKLLVQDAIKMERQRVKNLSALKCDNAAVNAILDVAIAEGGEVADVTKYIDALKNVETPKVENVAVNAITAAIRDNMQSGAENVTASLPTSVEDERMKKARALADVANSLRSGKRG